jgi:hypothetical protein
VWRVARTAPKRGTTPAPAPEPEPEADPAAASRPRRGGRRRSNRKSEEGEAA